MNHSCLWAISCCLLLLPRPIAKLAAQSGPVVSNLTQRNETLKQFCFSCHNNKLKTAGLTLEELDPGAAANSPEVWEKVIRKLRGHTMPPQGHALADADRAALHEWLEAPGRPAVP